MKKKAKKEFGEATLASIMKEMAKPRVTKSARQEEANRAAGRIMPVKQGKAKLQSHPHPLPLLRRAR
jgi:hypothetical protein